jgi:ankyrin repeat protein
MAELNEYFNAAQKPAPGALVRAIDNRDIKALYVLLNRGADPDEPDATGVTPMQAAVDGGWWRGAEILLKAGAAPPPYDGDPNGHYKYEGIVTNIHEEVKRETALTYLIKNAGGYRPIFDVLSKGADVNLKNKYRETPLSLSIDREWPFVSVQLVKRGAWINPEKPDPDEVVDPKTSATRLLAVIMEGQDAEAVERILEEGADPDKPDRYGLTPLALARALHWPAVEKMLVEYGADEDVAFPDPNQLVGPENDTPLLCYATSYQNCHENYKRALLEAGADPDLTDSKGMSAAHWAATYGDGRMFNALMEAGADIMMPDAKYGATPLDCASMNNSHYIVDQILQKYPPAIVNEAHGKEDKMPLHWAAGRKGAARLVEDLIARGALVNVCDKNGDTPLHKAVGARDPETVRILLEHGADVDKANEAKRYNAPLFSLVNSGFGEDGARNTNAEIAKLLLEHGADPDIKAKESINGPQAGDSVFYFAMSYRAFGVARALLEAGADPYGTSAAGASAMEYCLHLRQPEGVKLLLEYGFDPLREIEFTTFRADDDPQRGTSLALAESLVKRFGRETEYGEMLDIIKAHIAAEKKPVIKLAAAAKPVKKSPEAKIIDAVIEDMLAPGKDSAAKLLAARNRRAKAANPKT